MAKGMYKIPPKNPDVVITPEWIEAHKKELEDAGFPVISKKELDERTRNETAAQAASKDLLGIDLDKAEVVDQEAQGRSHDLYDFVIKARNQLELIFQSSQYRSKMTQKTQIGLHFVRTFIRQLLGESAPQHQAKNLKELIELSAGIPDGVLGDRVRAPAKPNPKKSFRLSQDHLEQAGIVGE